MWNALKKDTVALAFVWFSMGCDVLYNVFYYDSSFLYPKMMSMHTIPQDGVRACRCYGGICLPVGVNPRKEPGMELPDKAA